MPVATTSRRRNTRPQASSDIEEDQIPQQNHREDVDDDEDEDDQPRRRKKVAKKEQKPVVNRQANAKNNDHDQDDSDSDEDRIDVDNFPNQPLVSGLAGLEGLRKDWDQMSKRIKGGWRIVGDTASAMAETGEGDEGVKVRSYAFQPI